MYELAKTELVAARINLGLSIREAAKRIKVSEGTLDRAEKGEEIRISNKLKIVNYYVSEGALNVSHVTDVWPIETARVSA